MCGAEMGIADPNRKFKLEDMASADVIFSATGVRSTKIWEMAETEMTKL